MLCLIWTVSCYVISNPHNYNDSVYSAAVEVMF